MKGLWSLIPAGMFLLLSPWQAGGETAQGMTYLCALTEVIECSPLGDCVRVSPEDARLEDFIRIDLENGLLRAARPEDQRQTRIQATEVMDGKTILTGFENGRGWNAVLSEDKRDLTGTISDTRAGFVVFGACREE